jgi:hypothetical protein
MELVRSEFLRVWPGLHWIRANEALMRQAGQLIFWHNLKGFDGVQLASALLLKEETDGIELFFSGFDKNLNRAAQKEGFTIHRECYLYIEKVCKKDLYLFFPDSLCFHRQDDPFLSHLHCRI